MGSSSKNVLFLEHQPKSHKHFPLSFSHTAGISNPIAGHWLFERPNLKRQSFAFQMISFVADLQKLFFGSSDPHELDPLPQENLPLSHILILAQLQTCFFGALIVGVDGKTSDRFLLPLALRLSHDVIGDFEFNDVFLKVSKEDPSDFVLFVLWQFLAIVKSFCSGSDIAGPLNFSSAVGKLDPRWCAFFRSHFSLSGGALFFQVFRSLVQ